MYFGEHYMTIAEVGFHLLDNLDLGICSCLSFILVELTSFSIDRTQYLFY